MTDPADIASKRTPGPRANEGPDRLARFIRIGMTGQPMYVTANGVRQDVPPRLRPDVLWVRDFIAEAANTYDELLAVEEAARRLLEARTALFAYHGGTDDEYIDQLDREIAEADADLRASRAALDAAREKEGHRE